jgi:hypothetical protein
MSPDTPDLQLSSDFHLRHFAMIPSTALEHLSDRSRKCIQQLERYELEEKPDLSVLVMFLSLVSKLTTTKTCNLCQIFAIRLEARCCLSVIVRMCWRAAGVINYAIQDAPITSWSDCSSRRQGRRSGWRFCSDSCMPCRLVLEH